MRGSAEKKTFTCDTCGKTLSSNHCLQNHKLLHSAENRIAECECGKFYFKATTYWEHRQTDCPFWPQDTDSTDNDLPHKCPKCYEQFQFKGDLLVHTRTHHPPSFQRRYPCPESGCEEIFPQAHFLRKHLRKQHQTCTPVQSARQHETTDGRLVNPDAGQSDFHETVELQDNTPTLPHAATALPGSKKNVKRNKAMPKNTETKKIPQTSGVKRVRKKTVARSKGNDDANVQTGEDCISEKDEPELKCMICKDEHVYNSSLLSLFQPHTEGMRYLCPKCDVNLDKEDNLREYYRKAGIIMSL